MMRLVLDTNVLLSALMSPASLSAEQAWSARRLRLPTQRTVFTRSMRIRCSRWPEDSGPTTAADFLLPWSGLSATSMPSPATTCLYSRHHFFPPSVDAVGRIRTRIRTRAHAGRCAAEATALGCTAVRGSAHLELPFRCLWLLALLLLTCLSLHIRFLDRRS